MEPSAMVVLSALRGRQCVQALLAPLNAKHPITSESDVLATGAGFGIDGYGVGKFSGVEVLGEPERRSRAKIPGECAVVDRGLV